MEQSSTNAQIGDYNAQDKHTTPPTSWGPPPGPLLRIPFSESFVRVLPRSLPRILLRTPFPSPSLVDAPNGRQCNGVPLTLWSSSKPSGPSPKHRMMRPTDQPAVARPSHPSARAFARQRDRPPLRGHSVASQSFDGFGGRCFHLVLCSGRSRLRRDWPRRARRETRCGDQYGPRHTGGKVFCPHAAPVRWR